MQKYSIERILNEGQFLSSIVGTEYFEMNLNVAYSLFNQTVPLRINQIPSQNLNTKRYLRIEKVVNTCLEFGAEVKSEMEEALWLQYNMVCEDSQNPIEPNSARNKELNMDHFGIHSKEQLMEKTALSWMETSVQNDEEDDDMVYTTLNFSADWIGDGFFEFFFEGDQITNKTHHW